MSSAKQQDVAKLASRFMTGAAAPTAVAPRQGSSVTKPATTAATRRAPPPKRSAFGSTIPATRKPTSACKAPLPKAAQKAAATAACVGAASKASLLSAKPTAPATPPTSDCRARVSPPSSVAASPVNTAAPIPPASAPASTTPASVPRTRDDVTALIRERTGIALSPLTASTTFRCEGLLQRSAACLPGTDTALCSVYRGKMVTTQTLAGGQTRKEVVEVACKKACLPANTTPATFNKNFNIVSADLAGYAGAQAALKAGPCRAAAAKAVLPVLGWDVEGPVDGLFWVVYYTAWAPLGTLQQRIYDLACGAGLRRSARAHAPGEHPALPGTHLAWSELLSLLVAKVEQLALFRARGIVMPDNKFQNDLVTAVGCLAAIDWDGYQIVSAGSSPQCPLTAGTPTTADYAAPEQTQRRGPWTGFASHVWHLGKCLLEALALVEQVLQARAAHSGKPGVGSARNAEVLAGLRALAERCLVPQPEERPTLAALRTALARMQKTA
ncbi:hypothetical protein HYH03_001337 [Edaphochlamys debaryana]|uniref:Protein kinase domain-containing protein n=1 Tax=Edaphochlamys debaryana TaxID=47281 RepID=A0A835YCS3_9CHLO|nr:hypothetical protein HYH03_001337 [Edaphochlamys debaryana]|eukprot:KAG2500567.1 hypothetical protein HYH03_001337 [Edaphochlamys debaryana]